MRNWVKFDLRFRDLFGTTAQKAAGALQKLAFRMQLPDQSYTSYTEDVIALCSHMNFRMTEVQKLYHVTKGIREDAFHVCVVKNSSHASGNVVICVNLQDARSRRIQLPSPSPFTQSSGRSLPSTMFLGATWNMAHDGVREELNIHFLYSALNEPARDYEV